MPQARPAPGWTRRASLALLRLFGWRSVFTPLPGPKGVVVVYPHTSNWDFPIGVLFRYGVGVGAQWMGKESLFRGAMGVVMRALGGIPIDRRSPQGVTASMVELYRRTEALWIAITPEGTRSRVEYLKSGFYRIALAAGVPCGLGFIDYGTRTVGIDTYVHFTGDEERDLETLRAFYADKHGRRRGLEGRIAFQPRRASE